MDMENSKDRMDNSIEEILSTPKRKGQGKKCFTKAAATRANTKETASTGQAFSTGAMGAFTRETSREA